MKKNLEQGVVLVLAMMFIALLSLLGFSLLEQSFLELKMAHAFKERMIHSRAF